VHLEVNRTDTADTRPVVEPFVTGDDEVEPLVLRAETDTFLSQFEAEVP